MQKTFNFLGINSYDLIRQLDLALQSDQKITLDEVTATTEVGGTRTTEAVTNTEALEALQGEKDTPEAERPADKDSATIDDETAILQREACRLQTKFDIEKRREEKNVDTWNKDWRHTNQQLCAETTKKHTHTRL